jgi:hypothetical protein
MTKTVFHQQRIAIEKPTYRERSSCAEHRVCRRSQKSQGWVLLSRHRG